MSIVNEVWTTDIAENIYPDSSFIAQSIDESEFVDEHGAINSPISGVAPDVVINGTSFPVNPVQRTDTNNRYVCDAFRTKPIFVQNIEEMEVSYNKRASVLRDHQESLMAQQANMVAYNWAAEVAGQIVRTSGDTRTAFVAGATGDRKKITLDDLLKAKRVLDNQDVPSEGRVLLIPSEMYNDLLEIDNVIQANRHGKETLPSGAVDMLYGFAIYTRSSVVSYTNAALPLRRSPESGTAVDVAANAAAICYHPSFVKHGKGTVKVFTDDDNPTFYGSLFSAESKLASTKRYTDGRGIVSIVEAHV